MTDEAIVPKPDQKENGKVAFIHSLNKILMYVLLGLSKKIGTCCSLLEESDSFFFVFAQLFSFINTDVSNLARRGKTAKKKIDSND